jgi:hypothetical protein
MAGLVLVAIVCVVLVVVAMGRSVTGHGTQRIARCRAGHLFTSTVVPGASLKAVRLGTVRFQRCPVGHHWSIVGWVDPATLTPDQLAEARSHHDFPLP